MDDVAGFFMAMFFMAVMVITAVVTFSLVNNDRSAQDVADNRIRRVVVDGQECMVLAQRGGKLIALDCDWSDE